MEKVFINNFWLKEEIGKSSHSVIYEAADSETGKEVALKKIVAPALLLSVQKEDTIRNFACEIEARSCFSHPGVIELYDCLLYENDIFLVEELISGKNLAFYMRAGRYYTTLYPGLHIFQKIAEALLHAHRNAYIHRNIKPENIMITTDNNIKVTDFMVCSFLSREQKVRTALDADRYENITIYSAPETVRGGVLDERSNIFSTGVLMYEFFTGTHPFLGRTDEESYENIEKKAPVLASVLNPCLPEIVNYLIDKALKKDPRERYEDFKEFLDDLEYFYSKEKLHPVRINLYRSRKLQTAFLSTREASRRFLATHFRKLSLFSSQIVKKVRRAPSSPLFIDEIDTSRVRKKKNVREGLNPGAAPSLLPVSGEEPLVRQGAESQDEAASEAQGAVSVADETGVRQARETGEEIYSLKNPEALRLDKPLFSRRGTFFSENKRTIIGASAAILIISLAIVLAAYVNSTRRMKVEPVILPTKVVANTGNCCLMVKCNVGEAEVELLRVENDYPPLVGKLSIQGEWEVDGIASGEYLITIKKAGFYPHREKFALTEMDTYFLTAELGIMIPSLEIGTDPSGAIVKLDDEPFGSSPLKAYDTLPGKYLLSVELYGYETYREKVTIFKNETLMRKITMEKREIAVAKKTESSPSPSPSEESSPEPAPVKELSATLAIDSLPGVASVYIEGKEAGITPFEYKIAPFREKVAVVIKKNEFKDWKDTIMLSPGERKEIFAELESARSTVVKKSGMETEEYPESTHDGMSINYNVRYSRGSAFDKLTRKQLVIDFDRELVNNYVKKFVDSQLLHGGGPVGNFKINTIFAIQIESNPDFAHPKTYLVGSFQIVNSKTGRIILDESDTKEFSYNADSFDIVDSSYNYNTYMVVDRTSATEEAIKMFGRNEVKLEQALQGAQ